MWWPFKKPQTRRRTEQLEPPAVVFDDDKAEVRFNGQTQCVINWSDVERVEVEVTVFKEIGYSEAFWKLTSDSVQFGAPVELVVGSDEFNERLLGFPGFDKQAYKRARLAEASEEAGVFCCWRRPPNQALQTDRPSAGG